jgi:alcohol dehydrogenase class IV
MARSTDRTLCPGLAVGDCVIGLTFATSDPPHAQVHTIALPHATAYNGYGAPAAMARIAQALGAEDAAEGLFDLAASLGARQSLAEIACANQTSIAPPTSPFKAPTRTRPRSRASASLSSSTTPLMDAARTLV